MHTTLFFNKGPNSTVAVPADVHSYFTCDHYCSFYGWKQMSSMYIFAVSRGPTNVGISCTSWSYPLLLYIFYPTKLIDGFIK